MAKHYYQPLYSALVMNNTGGLPGIQQGIVEAVDADFIGSKSLKRLSIVGVAGISLDSGTPTHVNSAAGFYGFVKWPTDALAPVLATLDYQNSPRIFGRRQIVVSGLNSQRLSNKTGSVLLKGGETLYWFIHATVESGSTVVFNVRLNLEYWMTVSGGV